MNLQELLKELGNRIAVVWPLIVAAIVVSAIVLGLLALMEHFGARRKTPVSIRKEH